jgi:hypothetical protein
MEVKDSDRVTDFNAVQLPKALSSIEDIDEGMVIETRLVHNAKVPFLMALYIPGVMVTDDKLVQL